MKKTLVSALTTALVVGAASTTFAAANPFADVPADHWAYDAVAQLVQDGVVNGYSADGTFKSDQSMSRYEMAQIVAKAMAKSDAADNNNKALIEKLSAEFSDELANLGVRVADLEAKTDNVKWTGLIRYDWNTTNFEAEDEHRKPETNQLKLRFTPSITINENWTGYSEIDYDVNPDETGADNNGATVSKIYAEGVYGKADIKLGRFGSFSDASHGLFFDDKVTGAELTYAPTEKWAVKATGGRIDAKGTAFQTAGKVKGNADILGGTIPGIKDDISVPCEADGLIPSSATYYGIEVLYKNGKLDAGVGYHAAGANHTLVGNGHDKYQVVDAGVGYAFDSNVKATVDYARGTEFYVRGNEWPNDRFSKDAYSIQVSYKGANAAQKGSWGAYVAYRKLSPIAAFQATYDHKEGINEFNSLKGWEIGADYAWAKNIVSTFKFFTGKDTDKTVVQDKVTGVWSRVDFLF